MCVWDSSSMSKGITSPSAPPGLLASLSKNMLLSELNYGQDEDGVTALHMAGKRIKKVIKKYLFVQSF